MNQVTIVVPNGKATLSSIAGSFKILTQANAHWKKMGNKPMMEICIAGFMTELKLDAGFFSVHPVNIDEIKKTDLLIIPAVSYDDTLIKENAALIAWIRRCAKKAA